MRIGLDSIIFGLQRFGGISTYWIELARGLAAEAGLEVEQLLPSVVISGRAAEIAALGVPAQSERGLPPRVARYLPAPVLRGCDIQHSSYYRLPGRRGPAAVVTVYDFIYERYRSGAARQVHTLQKRHAVGGADAVICISENTRSDLLARWPAIDPAKVITVPLAVDHSAWFPAGAAEVQPMVLFVGQRGGYKRFDLAIAALAALPDLTLGIVGPPLTSTEQAELETRLPGRYRSFADIDNAELRRLYSSAHALLFPSDYEGFGLPLLEAMACGCPVVAAHQSCLPEVGGEAVLWARDQRADDYAAALARLTDSSVRSSAVAAGLTRAAGFTWASTVQQTIAVYRQLV